MSYNRLVFVGDDYWFSFHGRAYFVPCFSSSSSMEGMEAHEADRNFHGGVWIRYLGSDRRCSPELQRGFHYFYGSTYCSWENESTYMDFHERSTSTRLSWEAYRKYMRSVEETRQAFTMTRTSMEEAVPSIFSAAPPGSSPWLVRRGQGYSPGVEKKDEANKERCQLIDGRLCFTSFRQTTYHTQA